MRSKGTGHWRFLYGLGFGGCVGRNDGLLSNTKSGVLLRESTLVPVDSDLNRGDQTYSVSFFFGVVGLITGRRVRTFTPTPYSAATGLYDRDLVPLRPARGGCVDSTFVVYRYSLWIFSLLLYKDVDVIKEKNETNELIKLKILN